ncbi:3827_t:CDS:2, partial [Cetraspora pellucida]
MSEDFAKKGITSEQLLINSVLLQVKILLEQHHRKLSEYDLSQLNLPENQIRKNLLKLLTEELNILVNDDDLRKIELLNENQRKIFDKIMDHIKKNLKQSQLASLLRLTRLIIWDEIPMTHRHAVEALDRTLKDLMECDLPFG